MDVGNTNHWSATQVVPALVIVERIHARWPLEPVGPAYRGEVAARYRYRDGRGEIGIISSVTEPFCRDCHRARLSADGKLYTCLFAAAGLDVLGRLRAGADDAALMAMAEPAWAASHVPPPAGVPERLGAIRAALDPFLAACSALPEGGALTLEWPESLETCR
jgi:cyclic pyranopterin phosphate synthase